jgi:hypothetical protein
METPAEFEYREDKKRKEDEKLAAHPFNSRKEVSADARYIASQLWTLLFWIPLGAALLLSFILYLMRH